MGFINFLKRLRRSKMEGNTTEKVRTTSEYMKALAFNNAFANLLAQDKFIARSDYKALIETYDKVEQFFEILAQ